MRLFIVTALTVVSSCGADPGSTDGAAPAPTTTAPIDPATVQSLAIADATALPACDAARDHQLAYLIAEQQFQVCGNGAWTVIDIRGTPGSSGKDGQAGASGTNGVAGTNGTAGKDAPQTPTEQIIIDHGGKVVGTPHWTGSASDQLTVYLATGGAQLYLTGIATGTGLKYDAANIQGCYYTLPSCAGDCYLTDADKVGISGTSSVSVDVWMRTLDTSTINYQSHYTDGPGCQAATGSLYVGKGARQSYDLPFTLTTRFVP